MYDENGNFYDGEIPVSSLAAGFGFSSDREFDNYCDQFEQSISEMEIIDRMQSRGNR